jgi:hypothetical protein
MKKMQNDMPIMDKVKILSLKTRKQHYGTGVTFDWGTYNFVAKRVFYIYDINSSMTRGNHANINTTMCFIVLKGHCKILIDNGRKKQIFTLDNCDTMLFCSPMTWKEISDFSSDCVLMVICDTYFEANDYINDYNVFKESCLKRIKGQ